MKKGTKIGLLIGILLLAFGLTVMQIARHRGESFFFSVPSFSSVGTLSYDQKGFEVCRTGEESFSAKDVRELELDWINGSVSVERYDGKNVVVREKAAGTLTEDESMRFRLSGGKLSVLPCANNVRTLPEKELTVLIPRGLTLKGVDADSTSASVTLRDLDVEGAVGIDTLSGSQHVEDCRCAALSLNSSSGSQHVLRTEIAGKLDSDGISGSFEAKDVSCRALSTDTSSGSQKLSAVSCAELKLSSTSGSQRAAELSCRSVECDSTSGSVHLAFAEAPDKVDVEASSGSVELSFPKGTGIDLDYDRTSGSLHGEVIRGSIPVEVETTSGSLTIRYAD